MHHLHRHVTLTSDYVTCQLKLQSCQFKGFCVMYSILIPNIWTIWRSTCFIFPGKLNSFSETKRMTSSVSDVTVLLYLLFGLQNSFHLEKKLCQALHIFSNICTDFSDYIACFFQKVVNLLWNSKASKCVRVNSHKMNVCMCWHFSDVFCTCLFLIVKL